MILGLEIGMLIVGIMALVKGTVTLSKTRVVEGVPARIAGVIMLLPLPLSFAGGFMLGASRAMTKGGQVNVQEFQTTLIIMEVAIVLSCLAIGVVIALAASKHPEEKRPERKADYDDEPDDRIVRRDRPF